MKVYLAARYIRLDELVQYREALREAGIGCTSRWLNGTHKAADGNAAMYRLFAMHDLLDIRSADVLVNFSESPRTANASRGGRHVELGLAYGMGKPCLLVGPLENAFHALPGITRVDHFTQAITLLLEWAQQ